MGKVTRWVPESEAVRMIGCNPQTLQAGAARGQLTTCQSSFTGEHLYVRGELENLRTAINRELKRHVRG